MSSFLLNGAVLPVGSVITVNRNDLGDAQLFTVKVQDGEHVNRHAEITFSIRKNDGGDVTATISTVNTKGDTKTSQVRALYKGEKNPKPAKEKPAKAAPVAEAQVEAPAAEVPVAVG